MYFSFKSISYASSRQRKLELCYIDILYVNCWTWKPRYNPFLVLAKEGGVFTLVRASITEEGSMCDNQLDWFKLFGISGVIFIANIYASKKIYEHIKM